MGASGVSGKILICTKAAAYRYCPAPPTIVFSGTLYKISFPWYHKHMYIQQSCAVPECTRAALSQFDAAGELVEGAGCCLEHSPDPEKVRNDIYTYIQSHEKIIGMNASGITFMDIDLSGKKFYGCNFAFCEFINIHSAGFRSRMNIFDFSTFSDCNLLSSNIQFTSFAGCTFANTLFTGSDMVQDNFCGIEAYQCSFDDSDLYNSRFIRAKLINTSFRNCNVKKTVFNDLEQQNVSFKQSNTREAEFDRAGSELFQQAGYVGDINL